MNEDKKSNTLEIDAERLNVVTSKRTVYLTRCLNCGVKLRGELDKFRLVNRHEVEFECPVCKTYTCVNLKTLKRAEILVDAYAKPF